jgi:predicted lactoylglutathione lyase
LDLKYGTEVLFSIDAETREEVDEMAKKVVYMDMSKMSKE